MSEVKQTVRDKVKPWLREHLIEDSNLSFGLKKENLIWPAKLDDAIPEGWEVFIRMPE